MPRTFIPNIDDANAELIKLDGVLEGHTTNITKLTNDLKAANDLLAESGLQVAKLTGDLKAASEKATEFEGDLKTSGEKITKLECDVVTATNSATKTIAKAGVKPHEELATTGNDELDKNAGAKKLTGLQRAIAAEQANVAAARSRQSV